MSYTLRFSAILFVLALVVSLTILDESWDAALTYAAVLAIGSGVLMELFRRTNPE
jgi:hypothetical protein